MLASLYLIGWTCILAMFHAMRGTITRQWVDNRIQIWTKQMLRLWGITCKVINPGKVAPKKGVPTIIMCNHSSLFDIPLSFCAFPNASMRMLAKKELANLPIMGGGMRAADFPSIDRKNRKQAIKDLEVVQELLKSGIVMWLAPEGTRSDSGKLGKFKKGGFITAIQTGATIIPIGIRGASDIIPARTFRFYTHKTASVHVGEPVDASKYTLEDKDKLSDEVHASMKQLVGEAP